MPAEFCNPCRVRFGRLRAGVHRIEDEPMCEECFHGGSERAIADCRKSRVNVEAGSPRQEETTMPGPKGIDREALVRAIRAGLGAAELCEKFGISSSTLYYHAKKAGLKVTSSRANGNQRAGGASIEPAPRKPGRPAGRGINALARIPKANGGEPVLVPLTPRLSALIWSGVASLPPEQQAALISKLPEVE